MASSSSSPISPSANTIVADRTFGEIKEAVLGGRAVLFSLSGEIMPLSFISIEEERIIMLGGTLGGLRMTATDDNAYPSGNNGGGPK